jgi:hypothetical protein
MSVAPLTAPPIPGPRLRRLPRPACEPPYDDELPPAVRAARADRATAAFRPGSHVQGALALAFTVGRDVPALPEPPQQLRLLPDLSPAPLPARPGTAREQRAARELAAFCARRSTPRDALPEPRAWTARLTQALLEVLAGVRPLPQLAPWVTEEVYAGLAPRVRAAVRRTGRVGPPTRAVLRTLRVCEPVDGVAEATAVVQYGSRCRALALRLEGLDGRWRCTTLQLV